MIGNIISPYNIIITSSRKLAKEGWGMYITVKILNRNVSKEENDDYYSSHLVGESRLFPEQNNKLYIWLQR